jgi:enoyl-CoA hydratase
MSVVLTETAGPVSIVTLNRPEARNAIDGELSLEVARVLRNADGDDEVGAVVLTGADPAFCAGLDLKALSKTGLDAKTMEGDSWYAALRAMHKPVIGAVNGPAVTGGLEMALACDFLVASERARFADTHARVGAMPGGGMSVALAQAVGLRKAKELAFSGNYLDAATALACGLVNHVVPHEDLLPFAVGLAQQIATNDVALVWAMKALYDRNAATTVAEGLRNEHEAFVAHTVAPEEIARRRAGIQARGRLQSQPGSITS